MAEIAAEAHLSVGQIYRYFESKDDIVHAIVEHIISKRLAWIVSTEGNGDLPTVLAGRALSAEDDDDNAMLMEINAEASRNPTVAAIVRFADQRLQARGMAAVLMDRPLLDASRAAAIVEVLAALAQGAALRQATVQPARSAAVFEVYRSVIAHLLQT